MGVTTRAQRPLADFHRQRDGHLHVGRQNDFINAHGFSAFGPVGGNQLNYIDAVEYRRIDGVALGERASDAGTGAK